jgi:NNP family nitrate/nitrite transporter-like MFS transporter
MIGPLSTTYAGDLALSSTEASMLVATPILVGSIGRIIVGSLTDRFGGRTMFIAISLASIVPVLAVGAAGTAGSYPLLLVCGLFLGIAGTIFAVGIPFANSWFEASRRGFATGVFGMGNGGHRAIRVLDSAVRALVRPVHYPRHCRGRARAYRRGVRVGDAELPSVHA